MKTEEGLLKDKIKSWLKKRGAYFFMPVQTGYGMKTVDFLCCVPYDHWIDHEKTERRSRFLAIETKAKGKAPTPQQHMVLADVELAGGAAFWCDSFDSFLVNMVLWGLEPQPKD